MDALREKAFSGLDSFFEPEQRKSGVPRILLLIALLAALGAAGWWTYTNYLNATDSRKPQAASNPAAAAAGTSASTSAGNDAAPTPDASSSQAAPAAVPLGPSENATANPNTSPAPAQNTVNVETKPAAEPLPLTAAPEPTAPAKKVAGKPAPIAVSARAPKLPEPASPDAGDAAFRKAEAYLYGRGAPENCDEAIKYLKAASAKSNAKARSTFGTMYATGHCVSRDLPTSYLWFALALRADPNNQILEKDLSAIWNQMTPPERQQTTRMKQ